MRRLAWRCLPSIAVTFAYFAGIIRMIDPRVSLVFMLLATAMVLAAVHRGAV